MTHIDNLKKPRAIIIQASDGHWYSYTDGGQVILQDCTFVPQPKGRVLAYVLKDILRDFF